MSENTSVESTGSESSESSEILEADGSLQANESNEKPNSMTQDEWEEFNLKVNGKEIKERVNLKDRERITRALQMEKAAQQAFQERSITARQLEEIQGDVQEFLEQFTSNPLSVVMSPEFNLTKEQKRELAEAILREDLENSQKSPEQLALEETKRRYEELLAEKEALEEERRSAERQRLEQEAAIQLESEIVQAIEVGELPKSTYISKKLADLAYIAYSNGIDLPIADLIPFVKQQYKKDIAEMLGILSDDEVEMLVSKDRIRQIRNKQIQAVKPKENAPKSPLKTQDTGVSSKKEAEPQKIKAKDFFNSLRG
jgi:hypothetical protein